MWKCMQNYRLKTLTEEVKWRPRHTWKDNIKIIYNNMRALMELIWIRTGSNCSIFNTVLNIRFTWYGSLTSWRTTDYAVKILLWSLWRHECFLLTYISMSGVSALVPGQRTNYRSSHKNPVTENFIASSPDQQNFHEYHSSPRSNANVQRYGGSPTDPAQPSQFILPPPLTTSVYTQLTEDITAAVPSTQITRTYYGG
jgi:hypothetical protein